MKAGYVLFSFAVLGVSGCDGSPLDCASSSGKALVADFARQKSALVDRIGTDYIYSKLGDPEFSKNYNMHRFTDDILNSIRTDLKYNIDTIRTTAIDQATGSVECVLICKAMLENTVQRKCL